MAKTMAKLVVSVAFKANADPSVRTFEGLASTWDQDLGNDVIRKGAFKDTLKEWKGSQDAIPLLNSHDHWDVLSSLGQMIDAKETDQGLWTQWEVLDGPEGDAVLARLRPSKITGRPIIGKMSIGYEALEFSFEQPPGTESFWDRLRILTKVALKEVSLVLFPMNPGASIDPTTVKSFRELTQETDPRKLSVQTKTELRKLASRIGLLLKKEKDPTPPSDDPADDDDEIETPPAPIETPEGDDDGTDEIETDDEKSGKDDKETKEDEPVVYEMQEALQHRLAKLKLKNKTSELTNTNK